VAAITALLFLAMLDCPEKNLIIGILERAVADVKGELFDVKGPDRHGVQMDARRWIFGKPSARFLSDGSAMCWDGIIRLSERGLRL